MTMSDSYAMQYAMTEYADHVVRTMRRGVSLRDELTHLALGVAGELGEYYSSRWHRKLEEVGDVCWYLIALWHVAGRPQSEPGHPDDETLMGSGLLVCEQVKKLLYTYLTDCDLDAHLPRIGELALAAVRSVRREILGDAGLIAGLKQNVEKLQKRYPDGWKEGGGVRET